MKKTLLIMIVLLFATTSMWAGITPVYVNGTTGNDSWDGSSATYVSDLIGPKATIQAGIGAVSTGGTVNVAAGTYNEAITIGINLDLEGAAASTTIINGAGKGAPTIAVTAGAVKIRKFSIKEDNASDRSCIYVTGGTVDAGTSGDLGLNYFLVYGAGSAINNGQAVALNAVGNYWGKAKGPTISTSYCGNGGAIIGTGASVVVYSPWYDDAAFHNLVTPGGPVTTAASVAVCDGSLTADVPITVSAFTNVGIMSLKLTYNASELGTADSISKNADMNWSNFQVNTHTSGVILVSGYGTGITLTGTQTLFTVRFTKATAITTGTLVFVENAQGTTCEYSPDAPPLYAPFCDNPDETYYIAGGVTVVADPTLSQPGNVTICKGGSTTLTTAVSNGTGTFSYEWQYSANGTTGWATVTDNTPSGITYTNKTTDDLTISGDGSEAAAAKYYMCLLTSLVPSGNGCDATTTAVTVTTVADPTLSQPGNATICKGGSTTLTTAVSNGTGTFSYEWQYSANGTSDWATVVDNTPAGISYTNSTTDDLTITGSGSEAAAAKYYKCLLTSLTPSGGGCDATTTAVTVTTVADPSLSQPDNVTICKGGNTTLTTAVSNGTGTFSYEWQYSANGTSGWAAVVDDTPSGITYTNKTTDDLTITGDGNEAAAAKYYKCLLTSLVPSGAGCDATTTAVTVTTVADPTIATEPQSPAAICVGGTTADMTVTAANGTPSYTYKWKYQTSTSPDTWADVTNSTPTGAVYTGATALTMSVAGISVVGEYKYKCVVSASGSGCGDVTSAVVTVSVVADPTIATEPQSPAAICVGGTSADMTVTAANGTPSYTYKWKYQTDTDPDTWADVTNSTPTGAVYTGATALTMSVAGISVVGEYKYKCVVSASGSGCGDVTSAVVTVSVVADPTIATEPQSPAAICVGGTSADMTVTAANGTPSYTYKWKYQTSTDPDTWADVTNSTPTGAVYTGATALTMSVAGISVVGEYKYKCVVSASGSGCGDVTSAVVTVSVVADPTIATEPQSPAAICVGGTSADMTVTAANGTPSYTYKWKYQTSTDPDTWADVTNSTPTGAVYTGATALTMSVAGISVVGEYKYKCVVSASGSGCGDVTSAVVTVSVVADPTIATEPQSPAAICVGGTSADMTVTAANGTPSYTYKWKYQTDTDPDTWADVTNSTPTGAVYTGATALTMSVAGISVVGEYKYKCVVSASGSGCGDVTSAVVTVSVVADPTIATEPQSPAAICVGGTSADMTVTAANGTPSYTYKWKYQTDTDPDTWADVTNSTPTGAVYTGATALTMSVAGISVVGEYKYKCVVSASGSGCGDVTSAVVTVSVVADPTIATEPQSPAAICVGGTSADMTVTAANGTPSYTYKWKYQTDTDPDTWADVTNSTPTGAAYTGATALTMSVAGISVVGEYKYKCVVSASGSGCGDVTSAVVTVSVVADPSISVHPVSPDAICKNLSLSPLTVTASNGTPSLSYQWYSNATNSNTGGTSLGSGSGAQTNSYTPPTATAGTVYYYCVVSATGSGCGDATSNTATVVVNERKKISGVFNYYFLDGDVLLTGQDITVQLYKSSDGDHSEKIDEDVTTAAGYYEFLNLCPDCNYDIVATSSHTTEGAVNTTDAAQVNYYGPNHYLIEKVRFHAGDVGTDGILSDLTIQATDAGRIQRHFVYGTAFDNTWTFWKTGDLINSASTGESYPPVTLAVGYDLTANMYGLCTGDFNQSFDPSALKSASATLDLIYAGNRQISNNQEFDLPIRIVNGSQVGAISLILNFPAEFVEVKDVLMTGAGGQLDWAVLDNELRIGWNSSVPLNLSAGAELVTLRLKTTAAFIIGHSIKFSLAANPLNELADEMYNVIGNALLSIEVIDATALGIDDPVVANKIAMSNYPNPFSTFTTITYTLPYDGKVTLEISSILGKKVTCLVSETQLTGNHSVKFDTFNLPSGVYFATLRLKSADDELIRTIKLINNK